MLTGKEFAIWTFGLVVGAGACFLAVRKEAERAIQEEVDLVVEHYENKLKEVEEQEDILENTDTREGSINQYSKLVNLKYPEINEEEKKEGDIDMRVTELRGEEHKSSTPYVISFEEFFETNNEYDKCSIGYYADDETLVDEVDDLVDDPNYIVGPVALSKFGYLSQDPDIVYVRNDNLAIDYEIVREWISYQEKVLGETPDER